MALLQVLSSYFSPFTNEAIYFPVLIIVVALTSNTLARHLSKTINLSFALIQIFGGIVVCYFRDYLGIVGRSTDFILLQLNPRMVVFVFLPMALFYQNFLIEFYVFKKELVNIIIVGVVGTIMQITSLSLILKYVLGYGASHWSQVFILSAMVTATLTYTIVVILKGLGIPQKFMIIIQGSAFIGNGISYFVFTMSLESEMGAYTSLLQIIAHFVYNFLGAIVIGTVCALLSSFWLRKITRDEILLIIVVIASLYLMMYVLVFTPYGTSRGVTLLVFTQFLNAYGKANIQPKSLASLMKMLEQLYISLIGILYFILGVVVGHYFIAQSRQTMQVLHASDFASMVILYLVSHVTKFCCVYALSPVCQKFGYGIQTKQMVLIAYANFKGMNTLTCWAQVYFSDQFDTRFRQLCLLYGAGFTILSWFINGTFSRHFIRFMQIQSQVFKKHPAKDRIQKNCLSELLLSTMDMQKKIADDPRYKLADWDTVHSIMKLGVIKDKAEHLKEQIDRKNSSVHLSSVENCQSELRYRMYRNLLGYYWKKLQQLELSLVSYRILEEACYINIDKFDQPVDMWGDIFINFTATKMISTLFRVQSWFLVGRVVKNLISRNLSLIYEIATVYIISLEDYKVILKGYPVRKPVLEGILKEVNYQIMISQRYLDDLTQLFPEILRTVHTRRAAASLLMNMQNFINRNRFHISSRDHSSLLDMIDQKLSLVNNLNLKFALPNFNQFEIEFPLFHCLTFQELHEIKKNSVDLELEEGSVLFRKGDILMYFYIVVDGLIDVKIREDLVLKRSMGGVLMYTHLIGDNVRALVEAATVTRVRLKGLRIDQFRQVMNSNEQFKIKVYRNALFGLVRMLPEHSGVLSMIEETQLQGMVQQGGLVNMLRGSKLQLQFGGYLYSGELKATAAATGSYSMWSYLPNGKYQAVEDSLIY